MKGVLAGIGTVIGLIVFVLLLDFLFLKWFIFIEPQKEAARREVFLNTRSYIEGKTQELTKYYHEYTMAKTQKDREAIAAVIRVSFAEFDEKLIKSAMLRSFLIKIKYGGTLE